MHIDAFYVENVRSVRSKVEVDNLGLWEVFHGENNVGKSNLLLGLRAALILVDKVWRVSPAPQGDLEDEDNPKDDTESKAPGVALLAADELPQTLEPHWDREREPMRVGVRLKDPSSQNPRAISILFDVRRLDTTWDVQGRWSEQRTFDLGSQPPTEAPPPVQAPAVRFVDSARRPPDGNPTWDDWFLEQADQAQNSQQWIQAKRRLERALSALVVGFEGGRLGDRVRKTAPRRMRRSVEFRREFVWESSSHRALRFDEQGSGVRALKDLLVALAAGGGVCIGEEPEVHLSEALQLDLRRVLQQLTSPGDGLPPLQLILCSHSAMFDGATSRRVRREAGSTVVCDPSPRISAGDLGSPNARWVAEGGHNDSYVTGAGVVVLPEHVRVTMSLPNLLRFIPDGKGAFTIAAVSQPQTMPSNAATGGDGEST